MTRSVVSLAAATLCLFVPFGEGCTRGTSSSGRLELVWGQRGQSDGRFQKPRAMAIDDQDHLFVVDMTGRIQVFDRDGKFLRLWRTPAIEQGKPCGLAIDRDGNVAVADTHYFRVLFYAPQGKLLEDRTIGGTCGSKPGEFYFVTDVVQDSQGNYYVCEYGDFDRIQKFDRQGKFLLSWGSHGSMAGQFIQPRGMAIDDRDHIWVTDACNHRIQVFDSRSEPVQLVRMWGTEGKAPGQLSYPYGVALDGRGHVYVAEFGGCRVQKFSLDGRYLAHWGSPGRRPGDVNQPWGVVCDSLGSVHVLDTYNHRVQRIRL